MANRMLICSAIVIACILAAETADAAASFTASPPVTSHDSNTGQSLTDVINEEAALALSLASIATSGTAYVPYKQHHPLLLRQNSQLDAAAEYTGSSHVAEVSDNIDFKPTPPHKPLLPHLDRWDVLLLLCTAITLFIAAGGGIGGGAVFVVLFVFVGGFTAPQAVALSNITILGGSLANFIANSSRRHPTVDGPLIDWDLIMVMEPTTMLGALLGGYLNKLFPSWFTSCLLTALLVLLTYKLFKRGIRTFSVETRLQQQQRLHDKQQKQQQRRTAAAAGAEVVHNGLLTAAPQQQAVVLASDDQQQQHNVEAAAGNPLSISIGSHLTTLQHWQQPNILPAAAAAAAAGHGDSLKVPLLLPHYMSSSSSSVRGLSCLRCFPCFNPRKLRPTTIQAYERQQLPWQPILTLFFLSCWVVISDTLKVTLPCGTLGYWLVATSVIFPAVTVTLLVRQWLLTKAAVKAAATAAAWDESAVTSDVTSNTNNNNLVSAGIQWTPRNSLLYPGLCSAAGVVAGLFGVGGGIVKGPLMLELGVCPEVTAATSATMIMFTAGSAAVVYINFGGVVMDYAAALLLVGFFVTLLGQLCTVRLVKALGRRSVIIFAMCLLMLLATAAAGYQSVVAAVAAWDAAAAGAKVWHWGSICKHH